MDIEPFIVCEENGRLIELEGNRRSAAVRLLRDDGLSNKIYDATPIEREIHMTFSV